MVKCLFVDLGHLKPKTWDRGNPPRVGHSTAYHIHARKAVVEIGE